MNKNWQKISRTIVSHFMHMPGNKMKSKVEVEALISDDGVWVERHEEVAEAFNGYFASVCVKEDLTITTDNGAEMTRDSEPVLANCSSTVDDVRSKLQQVRQDKAQGPNDVSQLLLVNIKNEIAEPLYLIFRKSLNEGCVPEDWRIANVSHIYIWLREVPKGLL